MDGLITGENDERVGLSVVDNNDVEHLIEMEFNGEIKHHPIDGYANNPENRTVAENEHVAQAKRFAKFYVYRKRGYDAVPPLPNPDRLAAAMWAIRALPEDTFESLFGDYYQQMCNYPAGGDLIVNVPTEAHDNPLFFQKDVYLSLTHDDVRTFFTESGQPSQIEIEQLLAANEEDDSGESADRPYSIFKTAPEPTPTDEQHLAELLIEDISGVHVMWSPASNQTETIRTGPSDIDRKPDARFELSPFQPDSLAQFRDHLVKHLQCQIRDCYLTMGIAPPKRFRVQGPGWFDRSTWFQHYEVYEPYHRTDVSIDYWQEDTTPDEFL